jgi:predicted PurR-regulated permease PerM
MKNFENFLDNEIIGFRTWQLILLAFAVALVIYALKDFLYAVFLGLVIGYVLLPVTNKLNNYIKNRYISGAITLAMFYLPIIFMSWQVINWFVQELVTLFIQFSQFQNTSLSSYRFLNIFNPALLLWSLLQKIYSFLTNSLVASPSNLFKILISFLIILVISSFVVAEGPEWRQSLLRSVPRERRITFLRFIKRLDEVFYNIFVVQFYTAIIVFFLALIFFYLIGVKYVLIYSAASFLFAFIPIFDAWMICLLVAFFAYLKGEIVKALVVALVGSFLLSVLPGYVIRPKLAEKRAKVHGGLIFIGYLVGPFVFGPIGFLLAPAIFGFFQVVLEMIFGERQQQGPSS